MLEFLRLLLSPPRVLPLACFFLHGTTFLKDYFPPSPPVHTGVPFWVGVLPQNVLNEQMWPDRRLRLLLGTDRSHHCTGRWIAAPARNQTCSTQKTPTLEKTPIGSHWSRRFKNVIRADHHFGPAYFWA